MCVSKKMSARPIEGWNLKLHLGGRKLKHTAILHTLIIFVIIGLSTAEKEFQLCLDVRVIYSIFTLVYQSRYIPDLARGEYFRRAL